VVVEVLKEVEPVQKLDHFRVSALQRRTLSQIQWAFNWVCNSRTVFSLVFTRYYYYITFSVMAHSLDLQWHNWYFRERK